MPDSRVDVLVIGATGHQGRAVIRHLLAREDDFHVHGMTRDAGGEAAEGLTRRGVTVLEGDLFDRDSLRRVMEGMQGVFCVANFWMWGYERQVLQGKNAADIASEMGVRHFVFSGVGNHDQETGIPHFDSCWEIDRHIQQLDLENTILQPVFFMHNFERMSDDIVDGTLVMPLKEGVHLQMVDIDDVGKAAAVAFSNRERFVGTRHNLAGDELTLEQMARHFTDVLDVDVEPVHMSMERAREQMGEEAAQMYQWFNDVGYSADIDRLEETFDFRCTRLAEYLDKQGWHVKSSA